MMNEKVELNDLLARADFVSLHVPCLPETRGMVNADFLKRAPEEVVEGEREKREEAEARRVKIVEWLQRLPL